MKNVRTTAALMCIAVTGLFLSQCKKESVPGAQLSNRQHSYADNNNPSSAKSLFYDTIKNTSNPEDLFGRLHNLGMDYVQQYCEDSLPSTTSTYTQRYDEILAGLRQFFAEEIDDDRLQEYYDSHSITDYAEINEAVLDSLDDYEYTFSPATYTTINQQRNIILTHFSMTEGAAFSSYLSAALVHLGNLNSGSITFDQYIDNIITVETNFMGSGGYSSSYTSSLRLLALFRYSAGWIEWMQINDPDYGGDRSLSAPIGWKDVGMSDLTGVERGSFIGGILGGGGPGALAGGLIGGIFGSALEGYHQGWLKD